jgi:L-cysteine desulfidase
MSRSTGLGTIADRIASIIDSELKETVGCTDPIAIGLATASAAALYTKELSLQEIQEAVESITLELDMNIFKNAVAVGVPGTGMKGISISAVLGLLLHDVSRGLMLFSSLDSKILTYAVEIQKRIPVHVKVRTKPGNIFIQAAITWKDGTETASAVSDYHDNIIWTEINNNRTPIQDREQKNREHTASQLPLDSLDWLVNHILMTPESALEKIIRSFDINMRASEIGLTDRRKSLEIQSFERIYGKIFQEDNQKDKLAAPLKDTTIIKTARIRVAAATRLRMDGEPLQIMACGGSGNHGITFFITLLLGWKMEGITPGRSLLYGAALGILLLHRIKEETGILTPMCGCAIASGLASAAALTWGLGGDSGMMQQAMNLVLSNLGGIVCDGAKPACAYKTSLSAQVALESARMAASGVCVPPDEGLSTDSFKDLLDNLHRIHQEGMASFNTTMVSLLQSRK